ncbi:LLM class flavin-dependent oxidoreductase [Falsibacillus pallidus]|uniref:LLM class flavin-dependent oxidoreductase n=1 Tax=Falsibacillus pallidus TaxID=493781 RepID=UPI003D98C565
MKLSILDQSPISSNQSAQDALFESMKLAQVGERLGYTRYWMAEHHDLPGLACSAPEVMLGFIGAHTSCIRLGTGAVLLPYYKPFKVAEIHHTLGTLFPGRIDVGIGRAPGGSAEASSALSANFLEGVWNIPKAVKELVAFIDDSYQTENEHATLSASPVPVDAPVPWVLGTSKKSAALAAENGLAYAFGHFMTDEDGPAIVKSYREAFKEREKGQSAQVLAAVSAVCAETDEEAEDLALSSMIWAIQKSKGRLPSVEEAKSYPLSKEDEIAIVKMKKKMIIGNPEKVKEQLEVLKKNYQTDEIMIVTNVYSPEKRRKSYELIAKEVLPGN